MAAEPPAYDPERHDIVAPTRDDPMLAALSPVIGGVGGRWARSTGFWSPQRVMIVLLGFTFTLALLAKAPCHASAFPRTGVDSWLCYSDIPQMFRDRGLATGAIPYFDTGDYPRLEYPVVLGLVMWLTAAIARTAATLDAGAVRFFDVNAIVLLAAALVTLIASIRIAGRRPYDVALFALAPAIVLTSVINWDLIATALTALAMLAWAKRRPGLAGIALGLGISTKLYPLLLLGPLFLLCLRARTMREFWRITASTVVTWLAVNAPVYIFARDGWLEFWRFNESRLGDFGSIIYVLGLTGHPLSETVTNATILLAFGLCCTGIAYLAIAAPRRPRFASLAFLVVVAFCITNKVYSPQYVLWMLPLAALARPRWRDFLIWQGCEAAYWLSVWLFLGGAFSGTGGWLYSGAVMLRIVGTLYLSAMVIRDVLHPELDPVRRTGDDDPAFPWAEDDGWSDDGPGPGDDPERERDAAAARRRSAAPA